MHTVVTQEGNIKTRQMTLFLFINVLTDTKNMFVMASTENMVLNGASR